ncbi:MAG: hypothetical protein AAGL89_00045 [Pseudomonadota bacterium]
MKRRVFLGAGVTLAAAGAGYTAVFRPHSTPNRQPKMTDAHLAEIQAISTTSPRILFVGNSMTLRNDLAEVVQGIADQSGVHIGVATAASRGLRLIEAIRIDAFLATLNQGWDVVVLQDFSTTSLRSFDRWGSAYAMRKIAREAGTGSVILFPTWAFPSAHAVYQRGGGWLSKVPSDPEHFAATITDFYQTVATDQGWVRAPVTEAFLPDPSQWLEDDLHHPNEAGTFRIAEIIWQTIADAGWF